MEYLAILLGAVLIILLVAGLVYFFGNVIKASLSKNHEAQDRRPTKRRNL